MEHCRMQDGSRRASLSVRPELVLRLSKGEIEGERTA